MNDSTAWVKLRLVLVLVLAVGVAALAWPAGATPNAATIVVNSPLDAIANDGLCTLREAVIAANSDKRSGARAGECPAGSGADTILLPSGTYILTRSNTGEENASATGDLDITASVVISATGPVTITANAGYTHRIFHFLGGTSTLAGVHIVGGNLPARDAGAIYNQANLTVRDSTISGARSGGNGGAIFNNGSLTLVNVTLSGNRANGSGGGLHQAGGSASLNNVTTANNIADADANGSGDGGGVRVAGGSLSLHNSLLGGNTDASSVTKHPDCSGTLASNGYNLVQSAAGCTLQGGGPGHLTGLAPLLGPLQFNGGSTPTHALLADSPALDAGSPAAPGSGPGACAPVDQRGLSRPRGLACDLGAYEADFPTAPFIIRAVAQGGGALAVVRAAGTPNATLTVTLYSATTCGAEGPGGQLTVLGQATTTLDASGNAIVEITGSPAAEGGFVTARAAGASGDLSPFAACARISAGNDSWPHALTLPLAGSPMGAETTGYLDQPGQSRWFKFSVHPNSRLVVLLTDLPANYDLTVYKDIRATLESLSHLNDTSDLARLGVEFAPDAFSPDAFSPDAFSPDAFSPDAFSPDAFSPDAFSADVFSPDAFSPDAFSPDAFSPDAFSPDAFSPDAFSPDAFSPDAFSPDAFSPDAFSPDAFSGAQLRSLIAVSAFDGTAAEGVALNTWDNTGEFYVRVRGRNGAFNLQEPFHLEVSLSTGQCAGVSPAGLPAGSLSGSSGAYRTIILTDGGRLTHTAALNQRLADLAARPEVAGVVVDVSQDARVAAANAQADAYPACPVAKNLVAGAIKEIVDRYRVHNPLEYVVIVGGDNVIPFFRHPDQALLANEKNYVPPVRDNTASQASLRLSYVLSQDRYGAVIDVSLKGSEFPLPALAVGRLVETEAEIMAMLGAYLGTANGVVATPASSLVTGYDFLEDAALAVKAEFEAGTGQPAASLIAARDLSPEDPAAWTADQLRALLLAGRHDLVFLAGHFSAGSALAADFRTRLLAAEVLTSPVDFTNVILFSAGCHSGYNIVNEHGVPGVTREPDWAQAFSARGATLIAGTGYQYGDTDFIEYSERLYLEFSRQLRAGTGPVSVGQALVAAKQIYLADTPQMRPIHEKALLQATLFGLPMLSVDLPAGRGGAGGFATAASVSTAAVAPQPFAHNPGAALGLAFADLSVTPSLSQHSLTLNVLGENTTVQATYLSGSEGVLALPAEPVLPLELRDASAAGTMLRGVGFRGGLYTDVADQLPLTGAPATEVRGVHTPFVSDVYYPVRPWSVNYFSALLGGSGPRLAALPAQYRSTAPGSATSTLRRFEQMDFRLFYSANTHTYGSDSTPALAAPPSIVSVSGRPNGGQVDFEIRVSGNPAAGIHEVWVTYTAVQGPLAGRWQSLDLTQSALDSTLWQGTLNLGGASAADLRFMVQAANGVGLVSLDANQGAYHLPGGQAEPELATQVVLVSPPATAAYGSRVEFTAQLTHAGAPLPGQWLALALGAQTRLAQTDASGQAGATFSLLGLPGSYQVRASFGGSADYLPSSDQAPFEVVKQGTQLALSSAAVTVDVGQDTGLKAALTDSTGRPLGHQTVFFMLTGEAGAYSTAEITDYAGRASLGVVPLPAGVYAITAAFAGVIELPGDTLNLEDDRYHPARANAELTLLDPNTPPDCGAAYPSLTAIWPPNDALWNVSVLGVTDADGDALTITITGIRQDERTGESADGFGVGTSTAQVRAERDGSGDGRVYHIYYDASDGKGGVCSGVVRIAVSHDFGASIDAIDGGPLYDSTVAEQASS